VGKGDGVIVCTFKLFCFNMASLLIRAGMSPFQEWCTHGHMDVCEIHFNMFSLSGETIFKNKKIVLHWTNSIIPTLAVL
jgi:hypothetical protein